MLNCVNLFPKDCNMALHLANCQCGNLNIRVEADPDFCLVCNCRACQRRTGSPFGTGMYFKKSAVTILGAYKNWRRLSDSGLWLENHFCPECGTNLFWSLERRPEHYGVSYGCFATPVPEPSAAIFTEEAHEWVSFPLHWQTYPKRPPI